MTSINLQTRIKKLERKNIMIDPIPHIEFVYTDADTSNTEAIENFISNYRYPEKLTAQTEYCVVRYDNNHDIIITNCNHQGNQLSKPYPLTKSPNLPIEDFNVMDGVFRQELDRL